jgi:hypothetical protein
MGCGDSSTENHSWNENTTSVSLQTAGSEEVALRKQLEALGQTQQSGLNDFANFAKNGDYLALSPQHQATLDKAFDASRQQLQLEGKDYADFLSGSRGLRMSDTPISQQALQRYGLGLSALESNRALAGLNLGLTTNAARQTDRLNLSSAMPSGTVFGHNAIFNNRLAQPTTYSQGTGNTTVYNNPSLLTQVQQGAAAYKDFGSGTQSLMSAASMGMGMGMSDERLKQDIRPVAWRWKQNPDKEQLGVIAQELQQSHPHLVSRHENGHLMVDYGAMVAMLLNEREQLYAQLAEQKNSLSGLGADNSVLGSLEACHG